MTAEANFPVISALGSAEPYSETNQPFEVLISYADVSTRQYAMHLCQWLIEKFGDNFAFKCTWWRLDYLESPIIAHDAVAAAIEARLVIFSMHAAVPLPAVVPGWISQWIHRKTEEHHGLVLLTEGYALHSASLRATQTYFQNLANQARMDFFLCPIHSTGALAHNEERAHAISPLLQEILRRVPEAPNPRWGLNE